MISRRSFSESIALATTAAVADAHHGPRFNPPPAPQTALDLSEVHCFAVFVNDQRKPEIVCVDLRREQARSCATAYGRGRKGDTDTKVDIREIELSGRLK
ncbi:MAG: hypothetical protein Fues2KO_24140 [Fuerstiella sp.]